MFLPPQVYHPLLVWWTVLLNGRLNKNISQVCSLLLNMCLLLRCAFCQMDDIFTEYESRIFGHQGIKGVDEQE